MGTAGTSGRSITMDARAYGQYEQADVHVHALYKRLLLRPIWFGRARVPGRIIEDRRDTITKSIAFDGPYIFHVCLLLNIPLK